MRRSIRSAPRGFTLLEVLIATAITLLMMLSLLQVFKVVGDSMKQGRAALQMNNSLRSVTFRLRQDLNNLTIRVDPPTDASAGAGYLEYFDGSMTDYTATLFDPINGLDPSLTTNAVRSSRFGDMDDVLMFTARAGDSWFVGQVPAFVIDGTLSGTAAGNVPVSITSQLAEIAVFARPVNTSSSATVFFDDTDGNLMPDAYQLHYRVLLIRPDLNTNSFNNTPVLQGLTVGTANKVAAPLDMTTAFQLCDLSMRRVYDGDATTVDAVAANSLEDLMDPANRFAHFQYAIPSTVSATMPLLVMQPIPRAALPVFADDGNAATKSPLYSDPDPSAYTGALSSLSGSAGNFLHPSFTLTGARRGEDILAGEVLAFDVKAYDSGVPVIGVYGPDGKPGLGTIATLGADGTDDVVLTPNDPGYAPALTGTYSVMSYGSYVDLMWGRKSLCSLSYYGYNYNSLPTNPAPNLWTELSGLLPTTNPPNLNYSDGLRRSGKALDTPSFSILQPTFDTWTTKYESNGTIQAQFTGTSGIADIDAANRMNNQSSGTSDAASTGWRQNSIDAGTDGIDNDGTRGVDDAAEAETVPPFPVKLRGIKISVRIEDMATRQIKQMSVANEFVTQ